MKIQLKIRKTSGAELLTFRVRDGRSVEFSYATKVRIDVSELKRCYVCTEGEKYITSNLTKVDGLRRENEELNETIKKYADAINSVWNDIKCNPQLLNSQSFNERMGAKLEGREFRQKDSILEGAYESYINNQYENGMLSKGRYAHYMVSLRELHRFLVVNKMLSITIGEFSGSQLLKLYKFLMDEYKYVEKYPQLYVGMDDRQIPRAPRSQNTLSSKMKFYRSFFKKLSDSGDIERSPFMSAGDSNRKKMMKQRYDAPVYLKVEELEKIRNAEIPESLQEVRDCFILHCQLGARIEDFRALSWKDLKHHEDGFAYIVYQPSKTVEENGMIVKTPLMESGLRTILKYGFKFKCLNNLWGEDGYNAKIKEVARLSGLDREITITVGGLQYKKLYEIVSTKIARKTMVTALQQQQINDYVAGLHSEKSKAVYRYGDAPEELPNRYLLMCRAFKERPYKTDSNLNIL